ncbi:hypothetical protein ACFE04_010839 [Oxalis oulophora]
MGNILKQTANVSQQISAQSSAARPSIFQAIRCMSTSKIFIGGLSYSTDDQGLHESFSKYGEVIEAKVIMDRETQRSRGFGFVTYTTSEDAASAIEALNDQDLHGRNYGGNTGGGWDQGTGGNFGGGGSNVGYGDNNNAGGNAFGGASDNYANNGGNFGADNFGSSNTGFGATDDNFAGGNNSSGLDGKQDSAAV